MLWRDIQVVQNALTNILDPHDSVKWHLAWMGAIAGHHSFQGCLAFIICCASNIEAIQLNTPWLETTYDFFFRFLSVLCEKSGAIGKLFFPKLRETQVQAFEIPTMPFFPNLDSQGTQWSIRVVYPFIGIPRRHIQGPHSRTERYQLGRNGPVQLPSAIECTKSQTSSPVEYKQ
jgi:hypothetical protein